MIMIIVSLVLVMISGVMQAMTVTHTQRHTIGFRIAYIGCAAERVAPIIASDMTLSGHFSVDMSEWRNVPTKRHEITDLVQHNILFLLVLDAHKDALEYRLYDTTTGDMISKISGRCVVAEHKESLCAHYIADKMWSHLMGGQSPFNTHIAYAKEVPYKKGIVVKHICVADYDGNNEQVMVSAPTISIAPRWGGTVDNPLIFYSEYTDTNVRLSVVDKNKKRKVAMRYDGETMHLTPNHDGTMHAFSASRGDGNSQIYLLKDGILKQCTHDDAINAYPVFNHDSSVLYYYSDAETDIPHIMSYTFATKKHAALPIKGYCVEPAYNITRKLLAYSKMVDGSMQIYVYDSVTMWEKQLTFDVGNHENPTWSPCGNFLAYTHEVGDTSRIRIYAYTTGHERYITDSTVNCCYPAWSPY